MTNGDIGRDAHWFDGDGMLSGVSFRRLENGRIQPEFVNQYILTDLFLSSQANPRLRLPILPSIATLVNPLSTLLTVMLRIWRTILLVILSHLPGSQQVIKRISVANTALLFHDGRALATCESGPPMRISLPSLDTIGWYNGHHSEGEVEQSKEPGFGGVGFFSFFREFTTAHPKIDPLTKELFLFHSTFVPPYVTYSIIASDHQSGSKPGLSLTTSQPNKPVPGISSAKMMHDFGVTQTHTIIMDLPLSLDPLNLAKNKPVVAYDPVGRSRFGIFPRYEPERIQWFETNACCIFHVANSWNTSPDKVEAEHTETEMVNLLVCRLTSASLVFSAGDVAAPAPIHDIPPEQKEEEQCRLYYYEFLPDKSLRTNVIRHQWALAAIGFEFPSLKDTAAMTSARYIYGCSSGDSTFGAALGRAAKITHLVKIDALTLIERGKVNPPQQIKGCVDIRSMSEVESSNDPNDAIKVFKMPEGWYAQESRFVPRSNGTGEDDGWLLSYVFDESQLGEDGECLPDAKSELWVIDAKTMTDIVARVSLPQRVPYGLHGNWFSEQDVLSQRPFEKKRSMALVLSSKGKGQHSQSKAWRTWMAARAGVESYLA